ncbi:MAG: FAD-binding oxidoreductase [Acidimicrobiales bacterium]
MIRPRTSEDAKAILDQASQQGRSVLGRGLGSSYGDAAQNAGGLVVDLTGCDHILDFDPASRLVRAEAGISVDTLLRWSIPRGLFVPVSPGTRQVTLGGAVAADVHGKNHHRDGSFGRFVRQLRLVCPVGERVVTPELDPDVFWATVGGMGLTGLILEVTLQMERIESSLMVVDTRRARDLDECMAMMAESDVQYQYSVAWVDCLRRGNSLGRAVVASANHATTAEVTGALVGNRGAARHFSCSDPLSFEPRRRVDVRVASPIRFPTASLVRLFNEAWYRRAPRHRVGELESIASYFYPLDAVGSWNLLYGPQGFTQYQFVVPFGAEDVVSHVIRSLGERGHPSLLAVLKRFGPRDPAPLSFPVPGWTLALDLPLGRPGLGNELDRFDDMVATAGGRVYLAKDARLRPDLVSQMYPSLARWRKIRDELDPGRLFGSDMARRLHLIDGTPR